MLQIESIGFRKAPQEAGSGKQRKRERESDARQAHKNQEFESIGFEKVPERLAQDNGEAQDKLVRNAILELDPQEAGPGPSENRTKQYVKVLFLLI